MCACFFFTFSLFLLFFALSYVMSSATVMFTLILHPFFSFFIQTTTTPTTLSTPSATSLFRIPHPNHRTTGTIFLPSSVSILFLCSVPDTHAIRNTNTHITTHNDAFFFLSLSVVFPHHKPQLGTFFPFFCSGHV